MFALVCNLAALFGEPAASPLSQLVLVLQTLTAVWSLPVHAI